MKVLEKGLQAYVEQAPALTGASRCGEALHLLRAYPESDCIVVLDQADVPAGLVMRDRFFLSLNSPAGIDQHYRQPVKKWMSKPFVVDMSYSLPELLNGAAQRSIWNRFDSVIVTENGVYAGVISSEQLTQLFNYNV